MKRGYLNKISSKPLNKRNLHERCNLGARYHYLMRLGHMINVLTQYSEHLVKMIREFGIALRSAWLYPFCT